MEKERISVFQLVVLLYVCRSFNLLTATLHDVGAGYGAVQLAAYPLAAVFQLAADEASLESVTITPEHRGQGAGRALLTHALAALKAEGAALCFLEVRAHNTPALALYAALGFEAVGRRKNFYKNPPEDALVMRAEL